MMGSNGHNGNGVSFDGEPIDFREPWEILDGCPYDETALRSAHVAAVSLINDFAAVLESVLVRREATLNDVRVRFYGLCGALGLNVMHGRSFTELADELQVSRATLSKIAVEFVASHDLEPSFMMKKAETMPAYQTARINSIKRSNGHFKLPMPPPRGRRV